MPIDITAPYTLLILNNIVKISVAELEPPKLRSPEPPKTGGSATLPLIYSISFLCFRAAQFNNLEEVARIYSDAMEIDPRNKGTNAKILASRAEVYAKVFFLKSCRYQET